MHLVSSSDMRAIEAAADAGGLSFAQMMQNAGIAVARAADEWMGGNPGVIVVLCGPGNNGGDGLVAAERLAELGHAVRVLAWKRPAGDPLLESALRRPEIGVVDANGGDALAQLAAWLEGADLLIDSLLGTGASRPIEGRLADILATAAEAVAGTDGPAVIAVDLPSGLNADSGSADPATLPADVTVTFGFPKIGQFTWPGASFVGQMLVDDIAIPPELARLAAADLRVATAAAAQRYLPQPALDAHKGSFGHSLILAGSPQYLGAPALAAEAAARAGSGLVTLAMPADLVSAVAPRVPEAVWLPLPSYHDCGRDSSEIEAATQAFDKALSGATALLIGPGLSTAPGAAALLEHWLDRTSATQTIPYVLDADGLNLLSRIDGWARRLPSQGVLTPHPGEMARLTGRSSADINADRIGAAREFAVAWRQVVVLKGALTVIATPDGAAWILPFANPALATAGTGDVLAGLITGLLAQGLSPSGAALGGAWIHGQAGEIAAEELGTRAALARDLLERLPEVLQALEEGWADIGREPSQPR